jgi:hypothetical protein
MAIAQGKQFQVEKCHFLSETLVFSPNIGSRAFVNRTAVIHHISIYFSTHRFDGRKFMIKTIPEIFAWLKAETEWTPKVF